MIGFFDGASRGNPGEAGAGALLIENGIEIWNTAKYLGKKTNNEAEYNAVIALLTEAKRRGTVELQIFGDSKLVISQLTRKWKINIPHLRVLAEQAWKISEGMKVSYEWVPRIKNSRADMLSNEAIDKKQIILDESDIIILKHELKEANKMEEVYKFLKENPIFYVATIDKDQPRVRPFGVVAEFEGKLYLQTGNIKPVYRQMIANPKIELCTTAKDGTKWLRVEAEVELDDRIEARRQMLEENPMLRRLYSEDDGIGVVFKLKNATATFYSFTEAPRVVKF